ncbi:alpha/beta hydrolase [Pseudomaricurvus alkylphenolicus]|uniref:alpha/beta fold hydrolase n=1 Tax=Pseudomaricurvus alkylphenolicus TaxID=1306991 RepID=UPI00141E4E5A|nr:alpha/beta hydrolase [Pseudomaricurvus alkylphenolicus]NIB42197.1 alpha/beta hydrolase [Pseudomaricurvus alkylphenolicus]
MNTFITLATVVIAVLAVAYIFFPKPIIAMTTSLIRHQSRLTSHTMIVDGEQWHYLEGGPKDAELMVLVHGFGADKDNWTLYARYFTHKYRVIAPDLPGFGDSCWKTQRDYSAASQTARLHRFLQAKGLDKYHMAGNSMGGYITLTYALKYPQNLMTIALFNSAGVKGEHRCELDHAIQAGKNLFEVSSLEDFDRLLSLVAHKPIKIPNVFRRVKYQELIERQPHLNGVFWSVMSEIEQQPLNDKLPRVGVPCLIVWGRHDRLIDVSCVDVLSDSIDNSSSVILEDVGHVPMLECPQDVAQHHIRYIESATPV